MQIKTDLIADNASAEEYYFSQLQKDLFVIPRCNKCNSYHFYPRMFCPYCHSNNLLWVKASGKGTVYSTTTVRNQDRFYNISLIQLEEGPRLMSHVEEKSDQKTYIGMKVKAKILHENQSILVFEPEGQSNGK